MQKVTWRSFIGLFLLLLFATACRKEPTVLPPQSVLRVSCEIDPQTLDPRHTRDLATVTTIHMLYEGLMRHQADGQLVPALAESIEISPDQKTYTFKIRRSGWSNGQPVTAYDFEQSWKSLLEPQFPSPNAYQFYPIKGAQAAKEGKAALEHVGIQALDNQTLVVELEQPTPYFLSLTATHFYHPVHTELRCPSLVGCHSYDSLFVTNGPFKLEKWQHHNELSAIPNPYYWDRSHVHLDRIQLIVLDNPIALQLFQQGELEWTGSPLSTLSTDALASLKEKHQLHITPAAGVYLFRFNTAHAPFDHVKIRQAFALALNRQDLIEHVLQGNQKPALGLIPPSFIKKEPLFQDADLVKASQLFKEGLSEQGWTAAHFPAVTLCYASGERAQKIAQIAQQQWKEALGITINLQSCESKVYFDQLKKHDYQIGMGSWFADIQDPLSFLDVFKFKNNGTNNTEWENADYIALLNQSAQATSAAEREQMFKDAERIIIQDMPLIPLVYASYNHLKQPKVKGVYFSNLGYLDFKEAFIETEQ